MKTPPLTAFEQRKTEHIELALDPRNQAIGANGLDSIHLLHEAIPELDFDTLSLETHTLGYKLATPFFISSMTAGHANAEKINTLLALACETRGWAMGVGSQRRELTEPTHEKKSWKSENYFTRFLNRISLMNRLIIIHRCLHS